jgi:ParB family chromosome partitioning protein
MASQKNTTALAAAPTVLEVDPATLIPIDQARSDATPDDALVESVRQHGIIQPPTVTRNDEGDLVILTGHRRVGAAIVAGLPSIHVLVREGVDIDDVNRLEQQIVENERRRGLTSQELAQGYQRLELFGRTPADIAAELGETVDRVNAGLKVARSPKAAALMEDTSAPIDLERAAIIAEFEDQPKVMQELTDLAINRPENFAYKAEEARRVVRNKAKKRELIEQLNAAEVLIVKAPQYGWYTGVDNKGRELEQLVDDKGETIQQEAHYDCPGNAAIVNGGSAYSDAKVTYVCTDYAANGHHDKHQWARDHQAEDPEQEAREAERAAARRAREEEQAKHAANTTVRRDWIRGHLAGRLNQTPGIFDLVGDALYALLRYETGIPSNIVMQLLTGVPAVNDYNTQWDDDRLADALAAGEYLPLRVTVATAFAILEYCSASPIGVKYFERLKGWGYPLSDIDAEILAAAEKELEAEIAQHIEDAEATS